MTQIGRVGMRPRLVVVAGLSALLGAKALFAHDVTPKPVAAFLVRPDGERLSVTVRLPIGAVSDVNWPRDPSGRLIMDALEEPLGLVARQMATDIELEQGENLLPMPDARAALAVDGAFVDIDLVYRVRSGDGALSARLHPFWTGSVSVPAVARYESAPGIVRTFEITGAPERVMFNPGAGQAAAYFMRRGAQLLLDGWDLALFAIAIALLRHPGLRRSSIVGLFLAELVAAVLASTWTSIPAALAPAALVLAASIIIVAALQALVGAAPRWCVPLALAFGTASGSSIGHAFQDSVSFAGDHHLSSLTVLLAVIVLGQLWMLVLLFAAIDALDRNGVPMRATTIALSVYVCHSALHRLGDRAELLSQTSGIPPERIFLALTIGWTLVILVSAARAGAPPAMATFRGATGARA